MGKNLVLCVKILCSFYHEVLSEIANGMKRKSFVKEKCIIVVFETVKCWSWSKCTRSGRLHKISYINSMTDG